MSAMDLMQLSTVPNLWAYSAVLIAAIVEGEVAYIAAAAAVAQGGLDPAAVVVAGSMGAAIGDQAFFYAFRGRLPRWMARYPALERRTLPLLNRVRRHAPLMVLLIRFAPGLRVAITAACAAMDVSPFVFSTLNLLSSIVWAGSLLLLVGWLGPAFLGQFGLGGWKGAVLIGLVVLGAFKLLGRAEERALNRANT